MTDENILRSKGKISSEVGSSIVSGTKYLMIIHSQVQIYLSIKTIGCNYFISSLHSRRLGSVL